MSTKDPKCMQFQEIATAHTGKDPKTKVTTVSIESYTLTIEFLFFLTDYTSARSGWSQDQHFPILMCARTDTPLKRYVSKLKENSQFDYKIHREYGLVLKGDIWIGGHGPFFEIEPKTGEIKFSHHGPTLKITKGKK